MCLFESQIKEQELLALMVSMFLIKASKDVVVSKATILSKT